MRVAQRSATDGIDFSKLAGIVKGLERTKESDPSTTNKGEERTKTSGNGRRMMRSNLKRNEK